MGPALPFVAIAATVAGGVMQAAGQAQQASAASKAAAYNAQVSQRNSEVAIQNARLASEAGTAEVASQELKNRALSGEMAANQGASGVDVGSGSFKAVNESERQLGQLDAMTIRSNATKEAYGYETQAQNFQAQSSLDTAESKNASTAGKYAVAGTLLGTLGSATSQWQQFQLQGAINSPVNTSGAQKYPEDFLTVGY